MAEVSDNEIADGGGQLPGQRLARGGGFVDEAYCLERDEGIPFAHLPHMLFEPLGREAQFVCRGDGPHQARRIAARERSEADLDQSRMLSDLAQAFAEPGNIGEILFTSGADQEHRPALDPAAEEGEQPHAHLVGPVQILEDHDQGIMLGQVADEPRDRFEQS